MITNEQWKQVEEAYGNLIYVIAGKITGDKAFSRSDYIQMLFTKTLAVIASYEKKVDKPFDEIWGNPKSKEEFGQWLKTCLWNYKNTLGKEIKTRQEFLNKQLSISINSNNRNAEEDVSEVSVDIPSRDHFLLEDSMNIKWIHELLDPNAKQILKLVIDNPNCLTSDGLLNKVALTELSGLKQTDVEKSINKITFILQKGIWN